MMRINRMNKKVSATLLALLLFVTCFSATAFAAWDDTHYGYATYTGSGYSGGAVLLDPIPSTMEITALNPTNMNYGGVKAALAGAYLEVQGPKGKTTVYVTDLYPEGAPGALDLSHNAFAKIGNMVDGKINISWKVVKAPITGNFSYRIKEGSSQWWAAIQVRNHIYPVMKMEYYKDGQWINLEKMDYNHFLGTNMGNQKLSVRITDIRGQVVHDTIPALPNDGSNGAYIVPGNVQFPDNSPVITSPVVSGATYTLINPNSGKALDVAGRSTADGANVQIYTSNGGTNQQWVVTANGDGTYKVISVRSGKALDVSGGGAKDGTNVHQWTFNGGANQKWKIVANSDGTFKLIDSNSGKALDVNGGGTANGTNVQIWSDNGTVSQKWQLVKK